MGRNKRSNLPLSPAVRGRMISRAGHGLALVALLSPGLASADTYRWVDESNKVHYGDSIPAKDAGAGHEQLDSQGRVIKRVDSFSQSAEDRRKQDAAKARQQAAEEQQRRDRALLASYSSTDEIDQARERALSQEQDLLNSLLVLRRQSQTTQDMNAIDVKIIQRYKNMQAILAQFEADKARFRELSGQR
jgi:hypothetical protein